MSTKRTPRRRDFKHRVTPEAMQLFDLCCAIQAAEDDDFWEDEGGRRREYLDARVRLREVVGLKPWDACPTDPDLDGPVPWYIPAGKLYSVKSWKLAGDWRAALKAAMR
jgi:hypothetical protein